MNVVVRIPDHMRYTPGPSESQGLLVDQRNHTLIRLNNTGRAAWEALETGSWAAACTAFTQASQLNGDEAERSLLEFAQRLGEEGWLSIEVITAPEPGFDREPGADE